MRIATGRSGPRNDKNGRFLPQGAASSTPRTYPAALPLRDGFPAPACPAVGRPDRRPPFPARTEFSVQSSGLHLLVGADAHIGPPF